MSVLLKAAQVNDTFELKKSIEIKANLNQQDTYGITALMYSAAMGYIDNVKLLIEYGADISIKDNEGNTAFMWAQKNCRYDICELLLRKVSENGI